MSTYPEPQFFPGTLYDGNGDRLAGAGPEEFSLEMNASYPFKVLVHARHEIPDGALKADRFWLLPTSLGNPPELPKPLLDELLSILRNGGMVGLMGMDEALGEKVRDVLYLMLNEAGRA